jgi:hypothetical protein
MRWKRQQQNSFFERGMSNQQHNFDPDQPTQSEEPAFSFVPPPAQRVHARPGSQQVKAVAALALLGCMSFAMLIWYKLRVVTNVPRTAYAEPEQTQTSPTPAEESAKQPAENAVAPKP